MKISMLEMIKKLGGNRSVIAKASGTSEQHINNCVSKKRQAVELKDGSFVIVRDDAVFFKNP